MSCPPQTTVHVGQQLSIVVTWDNTGTNAHAFDVYVEIGTYDGTTHTPIANNIVYDVGSSAGQTGIPTEVPLGVIPQNLAGGTYYIMAAIMDYNSASPSNSVVYDLVECDNAIIISA